MPYKTDTYIVHIRKYAHSTYMPYKTRVTTILNQHTPMGVRCNACDNVVLPLQRLWQRCITVTTLVTTLYYRYNACDNVVLPLQRLWQRCITVAHLWRHITVTTLVVLLPLQHLRQRCITVAHLWQHITVTTLVVFKRGSSRQNKMIRQQHTCV